MSLKTHLSKIHSGTQTHAKKQNTNIGHMSKWCYYPLRMLIALAWTVAISAPGPRFLTKWSSLWVRLRCQSELCFNYPPAWPVAPEREECDSPAFPSDPPQTAPPPPPPPTPPHPNSSQRPVGLLLGLGLVQVAVSPATSSQFCKYVPGYGWHVARTCPSGGR